VPVATYNDIDEAYDDRLRCELPFLIVLLRRNFRLGSTDTSVRVLEAFGPIVGDSGEPADTA